MSDHPHGPEAAPARRGLPPGPSFLRGLSFVRKPLEFLDSCAAEFGDWFTLRLPGIAPFVFTSEPQAVHDVFAGSPEILHAGEANAPLGAFMGPESALFLDGAAHLQRRRLLLPPFHGDRMVAYGELMRRVTDHSIDSWPLGQPVRLHHAMQDISFEIILKAVYGMSDGPVLIALRDGLRRLFAIFNGRTGVLLGMPLFQHELGGTTPWGKVVRLKRQIEQILLTECERRRRDPSTDRQDVLSLLLGARDDEGRALTDAQLRDEMLTLMLAGHETTAASLAWVIYRVVTHPELAKAMRAELDEHGSDPAKVNSLPLLDAVIKESSRLTPVIPNVGRKLAVPMTIGNRDLPAGVVVAPCIYLAHRRPEVWTDPDTFEPSRFLSARFPPHAFFPFGGGVRRCLGAAFATYQMKVVLAALLTRTEIELPAGYRPVLKRRSIAFVPSEGLPVMLRTRR